ncbi:unnamed protein product [Rhizophagus irregularis]|uniref:Uncharacterized protein n=1 Tax=Rhizophagus irregularis TaxID=588596 RepID=A0A915YR76_9GLOM|nr:unnamed protein product [Rhizophagus irregularis]
MEQSHKSDRSEAVPDHILKVVKPAEAEPDHIIELAEVVPDQIPKVASKVIPMKGRMVHSIWFCPLNWSIPTKLISESSATLQDTSSSSIKASNIPTEIVSSDSNESGKEQTSKISESSAKLQDTSLSSIIASNKPTEIVSSDSNESASNKPTGFVSSDDESGKEQTSKVPESSAKLQDTSSLLFIKDFRKKPTGFVSSDDESGKEKTSKVPESSAKLQDTSSSLFIKDFRKKPTGFVSSDDESGKKDHQPSKKKSKMPEKSKKSSSIKASNRSTDIVSSDDESHQPKKIARIAKRNPNLRSPRSKENENNQLLDQILGQIQVQRELADWKLILVQLLPGK